MLSWKKSSQLRQPPLRIDVRSDPIYAKLRAKYGAPATASARPPEPQTNVGSIVDFETELGDVGPADLDAAAAEVWLKALDEVDAAYAADEWEVFVIYVTVETGDVMIYPTTMAKLDDSSAHVRIMLHSVGWANAYDAIAAPGESKKFNAAYKHLLKSIVKTFKDAVETSPLSPRFLALKKRPSFGIYYVDAVESIRREVLQFLWGNKAPDGLPASSAKELFEALLRRECSYIGKSLVYENDILRIVEMQGASFNDQYVSALEAVPNLAQVCTGLRELKLMATRIKPAAVERLRKLLPDVDVQVLAYKNNVGWYRKDR